VAFSISNYQDSSAVINQLREKYPSTTIPVLYAFFSSRENSKQKPANVAKALFGQLLQQSGRLPDSLISISFKKESNSLNLAMEDIWSAFSSVVAEFDRVYIILDGIDEYADGPEGFINHFQSLFNMPTMNVFVTSRPTLLNKTILGEFIELEIHPHTSELRKYIRSKLPQPQFCSNSQLKGRESLYNDIVEAIIDHSGGV